MTAVRMSAEERKQLVLDAALDEFAKGGLAGTSTESIAARAGISQPYLFRLFSTKKALFIEALRQSFAAIERRFDEVSRDLAGEAALDAMAGAYYEMLADRRLLLCQLHTYAACDDPQVQEAARACYGRLWRMIEQRSGVDNDQLREFFAMGMLCTVAAAMDLGKLGDEWAQAIMAGPRDCKSQPQ